MTRGRTVAVGAIAIALGLGVATWRQLAPLPTRLDAALPGAVAHPVLLARDAKVLDARYAGSWNSHALADPSRVPPLLVDALLSAEDQRFWTHGGADWLARAHAVVQNVAAGRVVRGASTISEQVVRMLHPRPRTPWSRWLEGFDAARLEHRFGKARVLAFYLDQLPYGRNRRGVRQAALAYFGRDVTTLSVVETLALAVLPRAPSRLDPARGADALHARVVQLAERMHGRVQLSAHELHTLDAPLFVEPPARGRSDDRHFMDAVRNVALPPQHTARTTLDREVQADVVRALRTRLARLSGAAVGGAASLVIDHRSGAVRAWASIGTGAVDAVRVPRPAGSTLKPFVYALAMEGGAAPDAVLDDAPLLQAVGFGAHAYRNFGRTYYGPVTLSEALGSSLNVPAVRALAPFGAATFAMRLHRFGFDSVTAHPDHYGAGLALGNAEVSLADLARAYGAIARDGRSLHVRYIESAPAEAGEAVMPGHVAKALTAILSDRYARTLEFEADGVLAFPRSVAVKTGTSGGHRDAWTVAFDRQHVVAAWMGNLDDRPMRGITGASGPAHVVRAVFAALHARGGGALGVDAVAPAMRAREAERGVSRMASPALRITFPPPQLHIARDPRIPDADEILLLEANGPRGTYRWRMNGELLTRNAGEPVRWRVSTGAHRLAVEVVDTAGRVHAAEVRFEVR